MNYVEFKSATVNFASEIIDGGMTRLSQFSGVTDLWIETRPIVKNNVTLDGVSLKRTGCNVAPTIYLNDLYEEFGDNVAMAVEKMAEVARVAYSQSSMEVDTNALGSWEYAKNRVFAKLVGSGNSELISGKPFKKMGDLYIIFAVRCDDALQDPFGRNVASYTITDDILESFGVNTQDLYEAAISNMAETAEVRSIDGILVEANLMEEGETTAVPMLVVTNKDRVYGTGSILVPKVRDLLAKALGTEEIMILPSSVHELLAISKDTTDVDSALAMVKEVNRSCLAPQEILSNSVYELTADSLLKPLTEAEAA